MRNRTSNVMHSALAMIITVAAWSPVQALSTEPADEKAMTATDMIEHCKSMKGQKQKLNDDVKAQDAEISKRILEVNSAPEDRKLALTSAILTDMVEQRVAMHARRSKMEEEMTRHMMRHMHLSKDVMSQCPMMQDVKATNETSGDAHKAHK